LLRSSLTAWQRYFQSDFHPSEHCTARAEAWLTAHSGLFQTVSRTS
jgi:predicted metal-dependent hydrolase